MNPIETSFELAGERFGDIAPQVYERLFAQFPEMQPLFVRDSTGLARGEMLARVIELAFDFLGPDHYASNFVRAEVVTHEGYGVPREVFPKFFEALAATLKDLLGPDWTMDMDASWTTLVGRLTELAKDPPASGDLLPALSK